MADAKGIKMGQGYVSLGVDRGPLDAGLEAAKSQFQAWGKGIAALGAVIAAGGAAVAAPFLSGMGDFMAWGAETRTAMRMANVSFEESRLLMNGMRLSAEELPATMAKVDEFMVAAAGGSREATTALADMGLTLEELQSMSRSDRMLAFADGLGRIGDESLRVARTRDIFGRGGLSANLDGGAAGIRTRAARADFLQGDSRSEEALRAAAALGRAKSEMGQAVGAIFQSLAYAAAPIMTEFYNLVSKIAIAVRQWTDANRPLLTTIFYIADKVILAGSIITFFGGVIYAASYAATFLQGALAIVGGALSWVAGVVVAILSPAIWVLTTSIAILQFGFGVLSTVVIGIVSTALSVLAGIAGVVVSGAFWVLAASMTVVKSGFGLLTLASMAWGMAGVFWSTVSAVAMAGYNAVVLAASLVMAGFNAAVFVASFAMGSYSAITSLAAMIVSGYSSALFFAGVALGVYAIATGVATTSTVGYLAAMILSALGITGHAATQIIATATTTAHLAAIVMATFGLNANTTATIIATAITIAHKVAVVASSIAMFAYKAAMIGVGVAYGIYSFMSGIATAATNIFTVSLIGAWIWENLVSGGLWLIVSALAAVVMAIMAFVAIAAVATLAALGWMASMFAIRTASEAATAAGNGLWSMVSGLASGISSMASGISSAFGDAVGRLMAYIGQFFTTFAETAAVAFGHVSALAVSSFRAIRDAFDAGDMSLVWDIFLLTAQIAWIRLYPAVISFKDGMVDLFRDAWMEISILGMTAWQRIKEFVFPIFAAMLQNAGVALSAVPGMQAQANALMAAAAAIPAQPVNDIQRAGIDARIRREAEEAGMRAWFDEQALRVARDDAAAAGDAPLLAQLQAELAGAEIQAWFAAQNAIVQREIPKIGDMMRGPLGGGPGNEKLSSMGGFNRFTPFTGAMAVDSETPAARNARLAAEALEGMRREAAERAIADRAMAEQAAAIRREADAALIARLEAVERLMEEEVQLLDRFEGVVMQ